MLYIVWVDHSLQFDYPSMSEEVENVKNKFKANLNEWIKEYEIKCLAEEYSIDWIKNAFSSLTIRITLENNARKELGYEEQKEIFDLEKIKASQNTNIVEYSVLYNIAQSHKIKHLFCDPWVEERKVIGIKNSVSECINEEEKRDHYFKRENYRLDVVSIQWDENILFVCGNDHINSLESLLKSKKLKYSILNIYNLTSN